MVDGFRDRFGRRQSEDDAHVCVGLDPLPEKIPSCIPAGPIWKRIAKQMCEIVDATAPFACMYKPQKAHYEAVPEGQKALHETTAYIHRRYATIPVFLDCKRGDIGRTQERYRVAHFEVDGADGVNFNPYMGKDCMELLVDKQRPSRAIVGLCYTSNSSAREVQDVLLADGRSYWELIAERTLQWAEELEIVDNAGLVMAAAFKRETSSGAICSEHLTRCREIVGNKLWFLIPGIGTQGGCIEETIRSSYRGAGSIALSSSSSIIFASTGSDFAIAAGEESRRLNDQIRLALQNLP